MKKRKKIPTDLVLVHRKKMKHKQFVCSAVHKQICKCLLIHISWLVEYSAPETLCNRGLYLSYNLGLWQKLSCLKEHKNTPSVPAAQVCSEQFSTLAV